MKKPRQPRAVSFARNPTDLGKNPKSGTTVFQDGTLSCFIDGRSLTWNFSSYKRQDLALQFGNAFYFLLLRGKRFKSYATLLGYRLSIGGFLSKIDAYDPKNRIHSIASIDRAFLDSLDNPNLTPSAYTRLQTIIVILREIRAMDVARVADDLRSEVQGDRLSFISRWPKPSTRPRDHYSPYVARQIEDAARNEMDKALTRLRSGIEDLERIKSLSLKQRTEGEEALLRVLNGSTFSESRKSYISRLNATGMIYMPTEPIDISSFDPRYLVLLAKVDSLGLRLDRDFELRMSRQRIRQIRRYSSEFRELVFQQEQLYFHSLCGFIHDSRVIQASLERLCVPPRLPTDAAGTGEELRSQLIIRIYVLNAWVRYGIPRARYDQIAFDRASVASWEDPSLGIQSIEDRRLARSRQLSDALETLDGLLERLARRYPGAPDRKQAVSLIRKIDVLEDAALNRRDVGLGDTPLQAFLRDWHDAERGINRTHQNNSVSTHPRYGGMVQWATSLLRGIRTQSCHRSSEKLRQDSLDVCDRRSLSERLAAVVPSIDELTSFLAKLGMMCQIDYGSAKLLSRSCLRNASDNFVDIVYSKRRNSSQIYSERVRDGSLETPGGLIRAVLEITEPAHQTLLARGDPNADLLWLGLHSSEVKPVRFQHPIYHPWWKFCERNEILDDDGERLDGIEPSRFRKTVKQLKYMKSGGDVFAIADDNSYSVARDNYANLPALAEVHDETVARGLGRALSDVAARVISHCTDVDLVATRLSDATGYDKAICRSAVEGKNDVWFAGCLGFKNSPFGKAGEDCPVPFSECLHCVNSVFTQRKLPNLLRFRAILNNRRVVVNDQEWEELYKADWYRLTKQIIPRFSAQQIAAAEAIVAKDDDDTSLFIPAAIGLAL